MNWFKKEKNIYLDVSLHCPDGLSESQGYDIPRQLDDFIDFINKFSKLKDYGITVNKTSVDEMLAKLKYNYRHNK